MPDMASRVELTCLMDIYGPLLTGHRVEIMRLYCEEDLSFSEIAQQTGISRQAVADAVQKSAARLRKYEQALLMLSRHRKITAEAERCIRCVAELPVSEEEKRPIIAALTNIIKTER